jgi:hypothetical protein
MAGFARKFLIVAVLLSITGGQWALLQSAAWAGMLVTNLRTQSVESAVKHTFDGAHPCPLCKAIRAGKKSEKKSEFEVKVVRMEFPPAGIDRTLIKADGLGSIRAVADAFADSLSVAPLKRPPRVMSA